MQTDLWTLGIVEKTMNKQKIMGPKYIKQIIMGQNISNKKMNSKRKTDCFLLSRMKKKKIFVYAKCE